MEIAVRPDIRIVLLLATILSHKSTLFEKYKVIMSLFGSSTRDVYQKMFTQKILGYISKDITAFRLCTSPLTTKNLIFDVEIFLWSYIPNCYLENLCLSVIGDTNIFQTDDISLVKLY